MISALFIFNAKGDVLMSRLFKSGVRQLVSDVFRIQVINTAARSNSSRDVRLPVLTLGSTSFLHTRLGNMWLVAVTRSNQDLLVIFEFLFTFAALLRHFFLKDPGHQLKEEVITGNFCAIYEMLGETLQFGYPTNMEPTYLASVVPGLPQPKTGFDFHASLRKPNSEKTLERAASSAMDHSYDSNMVLWRDSGIKYRRNEIFLNVDEKVNITLDNRGRCLRSFIDGVISMKTHLSGMPVCRFGFADDRSDTGLLDKISLDDFKFHKCVDLAKYDTDRVIRFVPPDGAFQLMSYHISNPFVLPFKVVPKVSVVGDRMTIRVILRSTFESTVAATGVTVTIPTPGEILKNNITCTNGKARYSPGENTITWKFSKVFGELEHSLIADLKLPEADEFLLKHPTTNRKPLGLDFTMDMFSASGLSVKFLKVVEKSNYRTVKWIKYTTLAGSYEIRM
uniref:MHD domain-containing protein n=1 Tax=Candidozyma auris TaxID=498019 RepID=A0A0L0NW51_CANAR